MDKSVCASWIPRQFISAIVFRTVNVYAATTANCEKLFGGGGIITRNETQIHHIEPESKRQRYGVLRTVTSEDTI